jgi:hypothetical protein
MSEALLERVAPKAHDIATAFLIALQHPKPV